MTWARLAVSWALALALLGFGLPRVVGVSWHVVLPVLTSVSWTAAVAMVLVWALGLLVHSWLLTASAPGLTRPRAVGVNVAGAAVASVMPFGGAAGLEVSRRMLRSWGIDTRAFASYALLVNTWAVACKLLLPVIAVLSLVWADERLTTAWQAAGIISGIAFLALVGVVAAVLVSPRDGIRRECRRLVVGGWRRMAAGSAGYAGLQCLLLALCVHVTRAGSSPAEIVAGFAAERMLTMLPITPGGIGIGDLGLVGVLLAFGGNPAGVTAAALLFRAFTFAVAVPVGACTLGAWLVGHRRRPTPLVTPRHTEGHGKREPALAARGSAGRATQGADTAAS